MATPTKTETKRVLKLRAAGRTWPEIMAELDKSVGFVHAVRKTMKEADPGSVAPSYDRAKAAKRRERADVK